MEEEECKKLIALADKINEEKAYQLDLNKSLDPSFSYENKSAQTTRVEGNYDQLYDRLRSERAAIQSSIRALEERVIDSIEVDDIRFDSGSFELPEQKKKTLDKASVLLKQNPGWEIDLSGHTDDIGSATYNDSLSMKRASKTRLYLESKGVNRRQIKMDFHGESLPKAPNRSDSSRAVNRRTEIKIRKPSN